MLARPSSSKSPRVSRETAELLSLRIDDLTDLSIQGTSSECTAEVTSRWCDIEAIHLPNNHWFMENFSVVFQRIFLRHDVIHTPEIAGDLYRINTDDGILSVDGLKIARRSSFLLSIPKDSDELPIAMKTLSRDPIHQLAQHEDREQLDLAEINLDLGPDIVYSNIIGRNMFELRLMTEFEAEGLNNDLSFIQEAITLGSRPTSN